VYDLGGGTFDVTVLRIENGNFDVLSTTGDRNLGGFDWDNALMSFVDERVRSEGGPDLLDGGQLETDLREKCEMAKRTLSNAAQAKVFVSAGGRSFTVAVTREQFESMTSGLVERTGSMVEEVLEDAGLRRADVDHVLLVGGSTRMPMVQAMMRELMGREPDTALHPDEAVALGAAIQAALIDGAAGKPSALDTAKPITVEDVTSQSLGVVAVEDAGGRHRSYNSIIIPHNTKVPCQHRNRYATVDDGQTQLKIEVTEGDDEDLDYVTLVGHSTLTIPPYPAGAPVEVIMSYDIDGMIHVEVVDLTSGSHLGEFELERAANRGGAELEAMADAVRRVEVQ
jgi:molecular chaperone DnaK